MGFKSSKRLELPSLSTKGMGEGESVILRFDTEYRKEKNMEGNEIMVANVTDLETGFNRKLAMPFLVFKHWEKIKGQVVRLTKGPKTGKARSWEVEIGEYDEKDIDKGKVKK
jgi:hypothetical protein